MMGVVGLLLILAGPLATLGIWLWLRSRRAPIALVEPLDIGRVLSRGFGVFAPAGWPVIGLAAVLVGVPQVVGALVIQPMVLAQAQAMPADPSHPFAMATRMWTGPFLIATLVGLVLMVAFYVAATAYLVPRYEGRPVSIGEALARTPGVGLPVLGACILAYFAILAAMCLFVLPGIVLALSWSVLVPVLVCEQVGFFASFSRSRWLAMGSRGRILLIFLLLLVIVIVASIPGGAMTAALSGRPEQTPSVFTTSWTVIFGIALAAFQASLFAGLYVELRHIRDGMSAPGLAEVFS